MSTRLIARAQKLFAQGVSLRDIAAELQCNVLRVALALKRSSATGA